MEDYPFILHTPEPSRLDWADEAAVSAYFSEKNPNLVLNFPQNFIEASSADVAAARSLSNACSAYDIAFIQLSSFRVFGTGYRAEGYREDELPMPSDSVGQTLLLMEQAALKCPKSILLRLPWALDLVSGSLFDRLIPRLLDNSMSGVSDHHRIHIVSAGYIVRCLIAIIHQIFCGAENWGVMHLRGAELSSEAEFADTSLRLLNSELGLQLQMPWVISGKEEGCWLPGSANILGRRCTDDFGIQFPSWRHGLKSLMRRWLHVHKLVPDMRRVERG